MLYPRKRAARSRFPLLVAAVAVLMAALLASSEVQATSASTGAGEGIAGEGVSVRDLAKPQVQDLLHSVTPFRDGVLKPSVLSRLAHGNTALDHMWGGQVSATNGTTMQLAQAVLAQNRRPRIIEGQGGGPKRSFQSATSDSPVYPNATRSPELEAKLPTSGIKVYITQNTETNFAYPDRQEIYLS
jgi:hypothetical protein